MSTSLDRIGSVEVAMHLKDAGRRASGNQSGLLTSVSLRRLTRERVVLW